MKKIINTIDFEKYAFIKAIGISDIGNGEIGMCDIEPINISNVGNRSVSYIGLHKAKNTFGCYITSKLLHGNAQVVKSHEIRHLSIIG